MRFRPCIDIHNGKVKQIVGSSLRDRGDAAEENFVAARDADYYAGLYRDRDLAGGHVILLNSVDSPYYGEDLRQAEKALGAFPGGLQVGGGVTADNAARFLAMGASHVIVTSYVFRGGEIRWDRLDRLAEAAGRDHVVLDVSCRIRDGRYYVVTDRWQKFTDVEVNAESLKKLSDCCDEFLVHAVDVEGKRSGIDARLAEMLGSESPIPVTYAGGVSGPEDILTIYKAGQGRVDVTIGSALDLFGGSMVFDETCDLFDRLSAGREAE